jgi:hypothetical protein
MTTRLEAAAWLIDTTEDRLLSHRDCGAGGLLAVIGPDGRKYVFTDEQISRAMKAMETPELAALTESKAKPRQRRAGAKRTTVRKAKRTAGKE